MMLFYHVLKQSLVEHQLSHLATMKFVRLKQLFVDAMLSNVLIISKDSPLLSQKLKAIR